MTQNNLKETETLIKTNDFTFSMKKENNQMAQNDFKKAESFINPPHIQKLLLKVLRQTSKQLKSLL